jgi:hypothetical protein
MKDYEFIRPGSTDADLAYSSFEEMEERDEEIVYAREFFAGAAALKNIPRVPGALYAQVMDTFDSTVTDWQQKFPDITPQEVALLTKEADFTGRDVRQRITAKHGITRKQLATLRPLHSSNAAQSTQQYRHELQRQQLPVGLLDAPDHEPQRTAMSCMTSCYRMIFKALAADSLKAPDAAAMTSLSEYGGYTFDEEILFKSLSMPLFRQKTGYTVTNRVIIGADFADIAKRATLVKQRIANAAVYATIGLRGFDDEAPGLHGVVLLDVDEDIVRFHNPRAREHPRSPNCTNHNSDGCGAFDTLDKTEFTERWAASMHEARLIIAQPDPIRADKVN